MTWGAIAWKAGPWAIILVLVTVIALQHAALTGADLGRLKAIQFQNDKAEALSNELIIAQAQAMAVTEKKVITYVDRIQASPDDAERNRLGSNGVRAIIRGGSAEGSGKPAPAVPGPRAGGRP